MRNAIQLPVIERLRVLNYPLYPGASKQGLDLAFDKGVTVIAGINGIGKTTLLNLLLRMLVGPTSPSKSAARDLGRLSKRTLVASKKFSYFQDRVAVPLGANAVAMLAFSIGSTRVTVTRRLTDLSITMLVVGGKGLKAPANGEFLSQMAELSGLSSAYDFHMVVRYVQFFTEERLPLLWSPVAQFELFKMLFADLKTAQTLNQHFAEIQRLDTDYRNRFYQHGVRTKRYEEERSKLGVDGSDLTALRTELASTKAELEQVSVEYRAANEKVLNLVAQRDEVGQVIDALENELDGEAHQFSHADAAYIAQALPSMDDKLRLLMQGLGSNQGCFVCGTRGKREAAAISKRLRTHHCFVCNALLPDTKASNVTPLASANLRKIEQRIEKLRNKLSAHQASLAELDSAYAVALGEVRPAASKRYELTTRLRLLSAQIPDTMDASQPPIAVELEAEKVQLEELASKRNDLNDRYRKQVDLLASEMSTMENHFAELLTRYAEDFLHEKVSVRFTRNSPFKVATGVSQINLPTFRIAMTSSTHLAVHERLTPTSVSESQKEFLDLAFRMALLDTLAGSGATMLIMETPEASLDSWFIARAAQMIRHFSPDDGQRVLIATSNINGTTMIPALLGLAARGSLKKLPENRRRRLVNLMALAEEPGVLRLDEARQSLSEELGRYVDG